MKKQKKRTNKVTCKQLENQLKRNGFVIRPAYRNNHIQEPQLSVYAKFLTYVLGA